MSFRPRHLLKGWSRLIALVGLFALLSIVGVHSAQTAVAAPNSQTPIEFELDLDEWALIPEDVTFQVGDTVVFNIDNIGRFPHALEVSNNTQHLHSPTIRGGETTILEITFNEGGEYAYVCPIPGHAELGMVGTLTVEGGDPAPDTGEFLGIPLMRINPRNGTVVESDSQDVRVILHDFTLDADNIDGANVDGEGHWDLVLNDELVESVSTPSFTLTDLPTGQHTITAALRNNDGTPLDPSVQVSTTIQVVPPLQEQLDIALSQAYFLSVDNFAGPVMMGGMGIPLVPNMIPPDMFMAMMAQMAQMSGFNPANMPANPGLLSAIYTSGDPRLVPGAEVNPMDFGTMRWDPAGFDTDITTLDQAMVIMKFVEWAKFFHKGFNGENILFPSPEMEAFMSLVFSAEGMMISQFTGANLMTPEGYITSISMDSGSSEVVDGTVRPIDQAAMLWALSDMIWTVKNTEDFPNIGAFVQQAATPEQMQQMMGMWDQTYMLVKANPVTDPKEKGLAIVALTWYAAAKGKGDTILINDIAQTIDALASDLGSIETTAFEKAVSIRGLIEAWRFTANSDYLDTSMDLWGELDGMWDADAGAFAPTLGATTYEYTPWDVGLIVGALSEIIGATGDSVSTEVKEQATRRFVDFFSNGIMASGFVHGPVPTPGRTGLLVSSISYDTESGTWTVNDSRYNTAGSQYAANELIWIEGTLQGRTTGFPETPTFIPIASSNFAAPSTPNVGDATPTGWMLAGLGAIGVLFVGSGAMVLARRKS